MLIQKGELSQTRGLASGTASGVRGETEAASESHGRDGKPKLPVGQLSVLSECRQKSPCLALTYILGLRAAWSPLCITAWHRMGDRQTDRQT